jgi:hypothetical protein
MGNVNRITNGLRDALTAYAQLDTHHTARIVVALFDVTEAKRTAPMLDELARSVQPASKAIAGVARSAPNIREYFLCACASPTSI